MHCDVSAGCDDGTLQVDFTGPFLSTFGLGPKYTLPFMCMLCLFSSYSTFICMLKFPSLACIVFIVPYIV